MTFKRPSIKGLKRHLSRSPTNSRNPSTDTNGPASPKSAISGKSPSGDEQSHDSSIRRDPLFYHTPLILLVEETLFNIPEGYFNKYSVVFRIKYLIQSEGQKIRDGHSDERPLRLDGVSAAEFRCLLNAMIREDSVGDLEMSWMEWTSALKLSTLWQMTTIRDLALRKIPSRIGTLDEWIAALRISTELKIQRLRDMAIRELTSNLTPSRKVELAIECGVSGWLNEAYTLLVTRPKGISAEEEEELGWKRTSSLFRMRHRRMEAKNTHDLAGDIQTTFKSEFSDIAAFDHSSISYLQPGLRTVTDSRAMQRDETYYFVDVIFLVENTLFKVPRFLFEQTSDVFRIKFSPQAAEDVVQDGSSDGQPLHLEGVRQADFRQLLKAMKVPSSTGTKLQQSLSKDPYDEPMPWKEWASVLRLSCMWKMPKTMGMAITQILENQFNEDEWKILLKLSTQLAITEIRDPAIQNLSGTLQPMEYVELGIECLVDSWLLEGYLQLVQSRGGITLIDEERLGWKTTSRLFRIRDRYLQRYGGTNSRDAKNYVSDEIMREFAEELKDAEWD